MKKILALLGIFSTFCGTLFGQIIGPSNEDADPAAGTIALVGGGNQISQIAQIDYPITNQAQVPAGTTGIIPIGALAVTISFPNEYGLQPGVTPVIANWTVLSHGLNQLVITNNQSLDSGQELVARISVVGLSQTSTAQTTTFTVDRATPIVVGNTTTANDVNEASLSVVTPLPITLVNFTAQQKNCGVVALDWATSKEQHVSHFELQYSQDGIQYSSVKRVRAQNAPMGATYAATVEQAGKEGFYRLKTVDIDGVFALSQVAKVVLTCDANVISISPNPALNAFNIAGLVTEAEVVLYNMIGQQVLKQQLKAGESKIDINTLPAGNYNIMISDAYGSKTTLKLIKL